MEDNKILIGRKSASDIFSEIEFNDNGLFLTDRKKQNVMRIDFDSGKKTITFNNLKFKIQIAEDRISLGDKLGESAIKITEDEILFNSKNVHINDHTNYSKDHVDVLLGAIDIFK